MDDKALLDAIRAIVREENASMQADIASLKQGQTNLELKQELILEKTIQAINDGMKNINEKFDRLDRVEDKIESHDHRIYAIEQAVGV